MKKILQYYQIYFPLIILAFYTLGFSYYYGFYKGFDVSIYYYLSLNDILFFIVTSLAIILIFSIGVEMIMRLFSALISCVIIRIYRKNLRECVRRIKYYNPPLISFLILCVIIFFVYKYVPFYSYFLIYLVPYFLFKIMDFISKYIPAKFIFTNKKISNKKLNKLKEKDKEGTIIRILASGFFFTVLGIVFLFLGEKECELIKTGKGVVKRQYSFELNNITYTNKNYIFIGETTTYLFLYEKDNNTTLIFNKQSISKFTNIAVNY